jgi:hypothetical protein
MAGNLAADRDVTIRVLVRGGGDDRAA